MFWPDTQTGVDVEPARKTVQSAVRKYFTEGGVGVPPTVPGGDWFNQITNELLNVLDAAGIDPSKADDDQLLTAIQLLKLNSIINVGDGDYRFQYNKDRSSLRTGMRDPRPLDDTLNFFRGLPEKDTWGSPLMHGIGSFSSGRNGASFAYLSYTIGHDCVAYGAAGFAGGAGSCAGNPDSPLADAQFGYCSFAMGKMVWALGRSSNAMGQETKAGSLVSSADGYASEANEGLASHPNGLFPGQANKGIVSEGRAARAYGWMAKAFGDFAAAIGAYIRAYNGSTAIGSGPAESTPAISDVPGSVSIFARSTTPGVSIVPDTGSLTKVGIHTKTPRERVETVINPGDKVAVRLTDPGSGGNGALALQSTLPDGRVVDILNVNWNNPSQTSAQGSVLISINAINSVEITKNGVVKLLSGSLEISQAGQGVKLMSPDGLTSRYLRLSNAGSLELI